MRKLFYFGKNIKQVLGVALAVIGVIIVVQVVPLTFWIFLLGLLLIGLGWILYRKY